MLVSTWIFQSSLRTCHLLTGNQNHQWLPPGSFQSNFNVILVASWPLQSGKTSKDWNYRSRTKFDSTILSGENGMHSVWWKNNHLNFELCFFLRPYQFLLFFSHFATTPDNLSIWTSNFRSNSHKARGNPSGPQIHRPFISFWSFLWAPQSLLLQGIQLCNFSRAARVF